MKIHTFGSLADLIESQIARIPLAKREGLLAGAELVKKGAQERIGTYQDAAGPFPAWAPLTAATQADRVAKGFPADEPLLRTGELRDAIEIKQVPEGAIVGVLGGEIAQVAASMEFGYFNVRANRPVAPRSFLRATAFTLFEPIGKAVGLRFLALLRRL